MYDFQLRIVRFGLWNGIQGLFEMESRPKKRPKAEGNGVASKSRGNWNGCKGKRPKEEVNEWDALTG